jgi:Tfp pilus assembly protein PilF
MSKTKTRMEARKPEREGLWLGVILAGAALVRLIYLLDLRRTPFFDHLLLDLASYDAWGRRIAAGEWLGSRVFYQDPLYPYFLGFIYALFGHRLWIVYLLQLALGTLTVYLVYRLARGYFSVPVARIAAALAALYKPFIFYDIQIDKSFLAVLLVTAACLLLWRAGQWNSGPAWICAGIVLGLLVLIRGNYLLLFPMILLGMLLFNAGRRRGRAIFLYGLGVALILFAALAHNLIVGKDLVLTTSQGGQNFYIGNNPENLTGMYRAPEFARGDPKFEEADFAREAERQLGRSLKPSEISNYWLKQGFAFLKERPLRFFRLLWVKTTLFWNNYEVPDNLDMYYFDAYSIIMRLWLPAFGLVAPFGILGMVLCISDRRRLWTLYLFALAYFASVILFFVFSRYRLPAVPFLLVFGAEAARRLWEQLRGRRFRSAAAAGSLLLLAGIAVNIPLGNTYNPSAIDNLGTMLLQMGDLDGAESLFRQVIARNADFSNARNNLAVALLRKGEVAAAVKELQEVIRLKPKQPAGYVNLGNALSKQGNAEGAAVNYRKALQLDPGSQEAWQGLGELHRQKGEFAAAADAFRNALRIDSDSASAHNNLAITLMALGRHAEALDEFDAAVRIDPGLSRAFFNKGICLERLGRADEAANSYKRAMEIAPDFAEACGNMAGLLADRGDRAGAIEYYQRFLERWKGDPDVRKAVEEEIRKLRQFP